MLTYELNKPKYNKKQIIKSKLYNENFRNLKVKIYCI